MRARLHASAVLVLVILAGAATLAGCLDATCGYGDSDPCTHHVKSVIGATSFAAAWERERAVAHYQSRGFTDATEADEPDYEGDRVRMRSPEGHLLVIVVPAAHLADPDAASWVWAFEVMYPSPKKAWSEVGAASAAETFQERTAAPLVADELAHLEATFGWTPRNEVSYRPVYEPVKS